VPNGQLKWFSTPLLTVRGGVLRWVLLQDATVPDD
jgi:hypothetical protein